MILADHERRNVGFGSGATSDHHWLPNRGQIRLSYSVLTIDIDSTICEVHGYAKQGATFGYTKVRGLHPLVATRADTGEVLHVRTRKGSANTGRGEQRFVREVVGRVRRAGATGPIVVRADAGFWSRKVIQACLDHGVAFSITVTRVTISTDSAA